MTLCDDHQRGNTPRYGGKRPPRTDCSECWDIYISRHPEAQPPDPNATATSEREQKLQLALDKTLRQLGEAKKKNQGLVDAVYQAAFDAGMALSIDQVPPPQPDRRKSGEERAVAMTSDWQLGKVTPDYNSEKCEERVEEYGDKIIRLTDIQRSAHPVKKLHVWLLGDLVEGELIFPGQEHLIDSSLYRQVSVDGPRILLNFLRRMLGNFEHVHVVGVIGNHGALGGRSRKSYNPETNADRMLYTNVRNILELGAKEERITWQIPAERNERSWYAIDDIGGYRTLLLHGDQLRYGPRAPSTFQKILAWRAGGIKESFSDIAYGHWHQAQRMRIGNITARINGSTESYNTYAQEWMGNMDEPSQWLLFVKPGRGVTSEYQVWLS